MGHSREQLPGSRFAELDVVRTRAYISVDGLVYPSGSLGAIVHVHRDGQAYEVELSDPAPAVITLEADELEAA